MGIWIRTQDKKTLICTVHIYADQPVNGNQICGISGLDSFSVLGKYDSQERVLQVLGELHKYIRDIEIAKLGAMDAYDAVYMLEMPAE